ncbi:MAG: SDR family NAD(P)-dependent oxidoreductase [Gammaproteobacteria bacterium]|nr:SDR family NAD(P)-dependent oxidoreductase [Gammaproteobacteria bacterium]
MSAAPLSDKVILLPGASQGIGAATAEILGAAGARLVAHYRGQPGDREGAEAAVAGIPADRSHLVAGDFTDNAAVERVWQEAVAWRGHVDVLVLNAAFMDPSGGIDDSEQNWEHSWDMHLQVNVQAQARLMRAAVRHFRTRGGGIIVLMSSWVAQRGVTDPKMIAYAASKGAIKAVAQSIARGYAKEGIYTYIIAPGIVKTRMSIDFAEMQGGEDAVTQTLAMREWVPPGEVGELIAFRAEGRLRHLSGATLDVNGSTYVR